MNGPRILSCELNHGGANNQIELTWKLDDQLLEGGRFSVDLKAVRRQADDIREALGVLEAVDAEYSSDPSAFADPLRELARAGSRFAKTVIGVTGSDETKKAAEPFRDWFKEKVVGAAKGEYEMVIVHRNLDKEGSKKYVAPWGLAFVPREGLDIDDLEPTRDAFAGFWCGQFRLAVVRPPGHKDAANIPSELHARDTKISAVLEIGPNRMRAVEERIPGSAVITSADELIDHAKQRKASHNFYYISLAHDGHGAYQLGGEEFDRHAFEHSHDLVNSKRVVITMFDGDCIMRDRMDWVEPLMMRHSGGLIVPETDILSARHRYFGWDFFKTTMRQAKSLTRAVDLAREALWPRSLLYGFYCNARHVYIDPIDTLEDVFEGVDEFIQSLDPGGAR